MEPTVIIKCTGAAEVALDELNLLHHFKTMSEEDYAHGRNVLIERGFKFPFSIWIDPDGVKWVVDGAQRTTILKRMFVDGIKLPEKFPAILVEAENKADAAKDIIASESKFADIDPAEFTDFLTEYEIKWDDVEDWANIPELGASEDDEGKSDGGSKQLKQVTCPACQHVFEV